MQPLMQPVSHVVVYATVYDHTVRYLSGMSDVKSTFSTIPMSVRTESEITCWHREQG